MRTQPSIIAAAIIALLAMTIGAGSASAGPEIRVPNPRHEFAPVPEGAEVIHDFILQNRGGSDLEIQKVETG